MAIDKSPLETFVSVTKDIVSTLRDSILFFLFLLLLFAPDMMKNQLKKAGFTKGSIPGFEWESR